MKKEPESKPRAVFATRFGAIAAIVGSSVGLGNIWRFPYEAGMHGGGAFLICYIVCVALLGIPVMCAEFAMGRGTRRNIFGAYKKLCPGGKWQLSGYLGILASFLIISFYSVVAGWTIEFCVQSALGTLEFNGAESNHEQFLELITDWRSVVWTIIFLAINFGVLTGGVTKGIERMANVMMPLLFLLLIAFCVNSFFMPGFEDGISFLFKPDFSKLTPSVMLGALGQAFFSLSLGLGGMMTYASYFKEDTHLARTAASSALLDTSVALLAGIIIFPAVFSFGLSPQAGPALVFEVLPHVFSQLPGGMLWSTLFFLLLFLASITSTVSMSEISISYFCDEKKLTRGKATALSAAIALTGGIICALSFGPLSSATLFGMTAFDLFDYAASNILLPVGGFICAIFVGWKLDRKFLAGQMTNHGHHRFPLLGILRFCLRYVAPAAILLIFLNSLGFL
ncbi:MAG: sodium-dependent transporter [Muribaculaceae bacterium]|nr:sodium-dependent transporter [Muribaculaceae bacterium]